jgi:hypothetical protein
MKKVMLTLAGMLFISLVAVNAQDSTRTTQPSVSQPSTTQQPSQDYQQRDMVKVKSNEVPASLRSTLQGSEYKGWESGTIYRSKSNDNYTVEIGEGTTKKTYRFDKSGKRIGDTNTPE